MKVGSLVECIVPSLQETKKNGNTLPVKLREILTIRELYKDTGLYFEERINIINQDTGKEYAYRIERFRELLPPMSITIEQFEYEKA